MKTYTFKYDFGDKVYLVRNSPVENFSDCPACEGEGKITMKNGETMTCPKCCHSDKRGQVKNWTKPYWHVSHNPFILTIGQQKVRRSKDTTEETYMCYETGIGSGSYYYVTELYPSIEEANAECDKRNSNTKE